MLTIVISLILDNINEEEFKHFLAVVFVSAYIVSIGADIALARYETAVLLHGVMGAVVGYLFSSGGNVFGDGFDITLNR